MGLMSFLEDCSDAFINTVEAIPDVIEDTTDNVVNGINNIIDWILD
jgi:hypothetical protein